MRLRKVSLNLFERSEVAELPQNMQRHFYPPRGMLLFSDKYSFSFKVCNELKLICWYAETWNLKNRSDLTPGVAIEMFTV